MKLIIKKSEWHRGNGHVGSRLLRHGDQKKCCLGFYGQQLGISDERLLDRYNPADCFDEKWPKWFEIENDKYSEFPPDLKKLIKINDSKSISDNERELTIKEIFACHDVEVEFID